MKETNRKQNYQHLTPATVTGQRFTQYYNHGWDFIKNEEGTWTTINEYPISPREIWDKHQDTHQIIGLRFGSTTKHITLDIDRKGIYHPINDPKPIKTITEALEAIGLCRHVCIQSSESQGIHLIFPLSEAQHTFKAACLVKTTLEAAQLEIKKGQLEIFPNPKRYAKNGQKSNYNGVRLPLQPNSGSYLLDEDLNIISDSVEDFLDQMDWAASGQDIETFSSQLDPAYEEYKGKKSWKKDGKSRKAQEWEKALEQIVSTGWTGYHQTNELLPKFVAYCIVFQKCVGAKLREAVKQAVINAPGYSQWCRHQHEIDKRVEEVCYYTERNEHYLPYCNFPNRSTNYNQTYNPQAMESKVSKRTEDIQTRLTQTVAHLESKGELPQQVVERRQAIIETAQELFGKGFSCRTLGQKQYRVLWHPKYRLSQSTIEKPETAPKPTTVKKTSVSQSNSKKAPRPKREKSKTQTVKKQCKPKPTEKLNQVRVKSSQKSQKMAKPQTTEMKVSRTQKIETRLIGAVAYLESKKELPQQVALRREAIIETAKELYGKGFSHRTLSQKKYRVLWHPQHRATEQTEQTEQTPSNSQTSRSTLPQEQPETAPTTPPSKQGETHSQSESVLFTPLYEVFDCNEALPQKKSKINPTTFQKSTPPTDPSPSDAPVQLSELPDDRKLENGDCRLEIGKNKPLSFKQEKICPQQSAPNNHQSPLCNLQLVDLPDHLTKRIASLHAAKQNFLNLGLSTPYSIKRLEAELMAEISELNSCSDLPGNQPPSNGKVDPVEPNDTEPEDTTEPTPSTLEAPQVDNTTKTSLTQSSTIENNQSSPSTNSQPRKLSKKKLLEKCDDYGIKVNRTIEGLIKSNTSEVVLNALEALREHKRQGQVKNPAGFLVKAIKEKWKPTTATNTPQTSPKPSSSPYLPNPTAAITEEFSQWYEKAIASGLVENIPTHDLPLYQHREPMVRVLTPNGRFPYDLLRWTQAREFYST